MTNIKIWKIINCLVQQSPTTAMQIRKKLSYSEKSIRNYIKNCYPILEKYNLTLDAIPGKGYFLHGEDDDIALLKNEINEQLHPHNYRMDSVDRIIYIIYKLLCFDKNLRISDLEKELFITRPSLHKDLEKVKSWLLTYDLKLERSRKHGIGIPFHEKRRRKALCSLILISTEQLSVFNQFVYPENFCRYTIQFSYAHPRMQNILKFIHVFEKQNNFKISKRDIIYMATMIGVSLDRIQQNHYVSVNENIKESLSKNPFVHILQESQQLLSSTFNITIPNEELLYFSALFLSLKNTNFDYVPKDIDQQVKIIIDEFTSLLYTSNFINEQSKRALEEGLFYHLRSILDKTRFDYDFTNPLLREIKEKYQDVYCLAEQIRPIVKNTTSIELPDDEIAFLVLHIAAAIEKTIQPLKALFLYEHRYSEIKFSQSLIEAHIKEVNIVKSIKYHDYLSSEMQGEYDIILTSFPLSIKDKEVFYIPILPDKTYIKKLQDKLRNIFVKRNYREL